MPLVRLAMILYDLIATPSALLHTDIRMRCSSTHIKSATRLLILSCHVLVRVGVHFRVELEFIKMGLRGLTVLFASGDYGVGSYLAHTASSRCAKAAPMWPASSPYVTAVGGTQVLTSSTCSPTTVSLFRGRAPQLRTWGIVIICRC